MLWKKGRRSANIEDRRGRRGGRAAGGIGGIGLIIAVGYFFFSGDPSLLIRQIAGGIGGQPQQTAPAQTSEQEQEVADFVSVVLADTEVVWGGIFEQNGLTYKDPVLVLYTDQTPTACGTGQAAAGPFYCPGDQKLYLDLSFLGEMKRMGAEGDFALAYVIAHEVGHHIQTLVGTAKKSPPDAGPLLPDRIESDPGQDGTPGRLLRRCLGASRAKTATNPGRGRHRRGYSRRQPPSATTISSAWPAVGSCPKPSPMGHRSSA